MDRYIKDSRRMLWADLILVCLAVLFISHVDMTLAVKLVFNLAVTLIGGLLGRPHYKRVKELKERTYLDLHWLNTMLGKEERAAQLPRPRWVKPPTYQDLPEA